MQTAHATKASGFEAVAYKNSANPNEIVISFAGTYDKDISGDVAADIGLATGEGSAQLLEAAEYYLQVKAANPGANITFTGHSLGGGLAALMGVFFGQQAFTFDQAPFANSAQDNSLLSNPLNIFTPDVAANLKRDLLAQGYPEADLSSLTNFLQLRQANGGIPNSNLVTNINVQGEFLSSAPATLYDRIGTETDLSNSSTGVSGVDLHSQALLAAFLQSDQTAAEGKALNDVTFKLTDLLKMIFDDSLYYRDPNNKDNPERNFLENLIRHEAGVQGSVNADVMVTRFTKDLWKLAQDGGLTMKDGNGPYINAMNDVSKALIAFAMQMYYEDTANAKNPSKELFTAITNGIKFNLSDVSEKFKAAIENNQKLNLNDAKGYALYFQNYLSNALVFNAEEHGLINTLLPYMRDWYVQAGTSGMVAEAIQNRSAFLLGGSGADSLTGGSEADLLVGNTGSDSLTGGDGNDYLLGGTGQDTLKGESGNDILLGGADVDTLDGGLGNDQLKGDTGVDVYQFTGSFGTDVITDSDGQGSITIDNTPISNGNKQAANIYQQESTGHTFTQLNGGSTLIISKADDPSRIIIKDWSTTKNLGIHLTGDTPAAPAATHSGDFVKLIDPKDVGTADDVYVMTDGNYTPDPNAPDGEPGAADLISGTAGKDAIFGLGGDDALSGMAGDDYIEGGSGSDVIQGGLGKDTLNGGAGDDAIYGASDQPLNPPTQVDFTRPTNTYLHPQGTGFNWTMGYNTTYSNGVPDSFSNAARNRLANDQGNIIDGGAGNDFIAAGTGADYVHGGADKDEIWGMDKDDILFGDGDNDVIYGDGNKESAGSVVWTRAENHGRDIIDGGDGNDILLGQGQDDIIFGGTGNDTIWGDDENGTTAEPYGNDYLEGGAGNDELHGGAGNDIYVFNKGDGIDTVYDDLTPGANTFRFGAGVNAADIKLRKGSLLLDLGEGDAIHIEGFDTQDAMNSVAISNFEFDDGTVLTSGQLLARGFDLDGTSGNDMITGTNITDRINGSAGDDTLIGELGQDSLSGGDGNDILAGDQGDTDPDGGDADWLDGGNGDDALFGQGGDDTLLGGTGNDQLQGGMGDDIYHLNLGDGQDLLIDANGVNTIVFGIGITVDSIRATYDRINGNLSLSYGAGNDRVALYANGDTFEQGLSGNVIQSYQFADGTQFSHAELIQRALPALGYMGTVRQDVVISGGQADTLDGGGGDDLLIAQGGNDSLSGGLGNDSLDGGADDDVLSGGVGADVLYGGGGNDHIDGDVGDDILIGGGGNDTLNGGFGNDIYRIARGDGSDRLIEINSGTSFDRVVFDADILPDDVSYHRLDNGDLQIRITDSSDSFTINAWFNTTTPPVESILFGDGTELTGEALLTLPIVPITGTGDHDLLIGTDYDDTLLGLDGDDTLEGGAGIDTLSGGQGQDIYHLARGVGKDLIVETAGNSSVIQLADHLNLRDLTTARENDNLFLNIRGTEDGYVIANYYLANEDWIVRDSNGIEQSLANIVAIENSEEQDYYNLLKDDFFANVKFDIQQIYTPEMGFVPAANGALIRSWENDGSHVSRYINNLYQTVTTTYSINGNTTTETNQYNSIGGWVGHPDLYVSTILTQHETIFSDATEINDFEFSAWTFSQDVQSITTTVAWGADYNINETYTSTTTTLPIYDWRGEVVGYSTSENLQHHYSAYQDALVVAIEPFNPSISSTQVSGRLISNYWTANLLEISAGASNNSIYTHNPYTAVNGGGGDDTLIGGTLLYGGSGNDLLIDGNSLYGGEGNDTLIGGAIMNGGGGRDTIYTNQDDAKVLIDSNTTTVLIGGDGMGYSISFLNHMYAAMGIVDWQERFTSAGRYHLILPSGVGGYDGDYEEIGNRDSLLVSVHDWVNPNLTWDEVIANGWVHYIEPLPVIVNSSHLYSSGYYEGTDTPVISYSANDYQTLANYFSEGAIPNHIVVFGDSIELHDLRLSWGQVNASISGQDVNTLHTTLNITWGAEQQIQVLIPHSDEPIGSSVSAFDFANGTRLTMAEMIALAPTAPSFDPNILVFESGMGAITLTEGIDRIQFGAGITADMITLGLGSLMLRIGTYGDEIHIENFDPSNALDSPVWDFRFTDGTSLSYEELVARGFDIIGSQGSNFLTGTNIHDRIHGMEGNDVITSGDGDDLLDGGAGNDYLQGDSGNDTYVFGLGSGEDVIDDINGSFDKIIVQGIVGPDELIVAQEGDYIALSLKNGADKLSIYWYGDVDSKIESIEFANGTIWDAAMLEEVAASPNVKPIIVNHLANQYVLEDALFSYSIAGVFEDPNTDDVLSYSVNLANGDPLPSWLNFNPDTLSFNGIPQNSDVDSLTLKVTATDAAGAFMSGDFNIVVVNTNDAPTITRTVADQTTDEGALFSFTIPSDTFADVDLGDSLTYSATLADGSALPAWLSFDAVTGRFSGTPANDDVGMLEISITATDIVGTSAGQHFMLDVGNVNDAPLLTHPAGNQMAIEDSVFSFTVPASNFSDADRGDALTYTAMLANGDPLPAWLSFDPATRIFSGVPGNNDVGSLSLRVTATDLAGAAVSDLFELAVNNINDAPVTVADSATVREDQVLEASGNLLANDSDIDAGTVLHVADAGTRQGVYGNLQIDADGSYLYVLDNMAAQSLGDSESAIEHFSYVASDGTVSTVSELAITVYGENDAPGLNDPMAAVNLTAGTSFSWKLPTGAFFDVDIHDSLTYTATLENGADLPSWLSFDTATQLLTGTPGSDAAGTLRLKIAVSDGHGGTASRALELGIAPTPQGKTLIGTPRPDTLIGTPYDDIFNGRGSVDTLIGGDGDDLYLIDANHGEDAECDGHHDHARHDDDDHTSVDRIVESASGGFDTVWSSTNYVLPNHVESLHLLGENELNGVGTSAGNLLAGNRGANRLEGLAGNDLLLGNAGNDHLLGGNGSDALDGGGGNDLLEDGAGTGFLAGGKGNDIIRLGSGNDIIAFNRGDGQDRIENGDGQNDVLSLSGGIRIADLKLSKQGQDLVLATGGQDAMRFSGWYKSDAHKSVAILQIAAASSSSPIGQSYEYFNFSGLVGEFDKVRTANKGLDSWAVSNAAARYRVGGSDTESFGGALATAYAQEGDIEDLSLETVSDALATSKADAEIPESNTSTVLPPSGGAPETPYGCDSDKDRYHPSLWKDDKDQHAKHGGLKKWLTPDDLSWTCGDHRHPSHDYGQGRSVSDPRVDYAVSWAYLRDKLAGRLNDDGSAPDWRPSITSHDLLGTSTSTPSTHGQVSMAISGNLLKPFEGLKEGFDRLR